MYCKKCGKKKYWATVCPYCGKVGVNKKGGSYANKKANDRREPKKNEQG